MLGSNSLALKRLSRSEAKDSRGARLVMAGHYPLSTRPRQISIRALGACSKHQSTRPVTLLVAQHSVSASTLSCRNPHGLPANTLQKSQPNDLPLPIGTSQMTGSVFSVPNRNESRLVQPSLRGLMALLPLSALTQQIAVLVQVNHKERRFFRLFFHCREFLENGYLNLDTLHSLP